MRDGDGVREMFEDMYSVSFVCFNDETFEQQ
jgi:hypothetical protein